VCLICFYFVCSLTYAFHTVINGEMRGYQMQGLNCMVSLHHNGPNSILADEIPVLAPCLTHFRMSGLQQDGGVSAALKQALGLAAPPEWGIPPSGWFPATIERILIRPCNQSAWCGNVRAQHYSC